MTRLGLIAAALMGLSSAALADLAPVAKVEVDFDIEAVKSPEAAVFWKDLGTDLEAAIAARVAGRTAEEGSEIRIDIDEFDLSNSFERAIGENSVLVGDINVTNEIDATKDQFYDLKVTALEGAKLVPGYPGMTLVAIPSGEIYRAMIDTFAEGVVSRLE